MGFLNFSKKNEESKISKRDKSFFPSLKKKKKDLFMENRIQFNHVEIDDLTPWFKEQLTTINSVEDVTLLVLKKTNDLLKDFNLNAENLLVQCIYDTKSNTIINSQIIEYKTLSDTVINAFFDTDMIVLK